MCIIQSMKTVFILKLLLFLLFVSPSYLFASIDFTKNSQDIMLHSQIYIDKEGKSFADIQKEKFKAVYKKNLNIGFVRDTTLWIKVKFYNGSDKEVVRYLQIRNPLLERIILYDGRKYLQKGTLTLQKPRDTLHTVFALSLQAKELKTYYIKINNSTTTLRLGMSLQDKQSTLKDEFREKLVIYIFFTILFVILFYNAALYLYTKERVYIYYGMYLFTLILQQSTYLGITQLYCPAWFIHYDNLSVVLKVNLMYMSAIVFARSFLHTKKYRFIDKIYKTIFIVAVVEIPLIGTPWFYVPEVAIFTALLFIYFNMYVGLYLYKKGYTQARLFIVGWFFQLIGFTLMILDGLGLISVMYNLSPLIMFLTSFEAMILSLAFIDNYIILKNEKEKSDAVLVHELQNRQKIIESEIKNATCKLNLSLQNKQNLLKELHHRSKNNMQLILSLIRMQSDEGDDVMKEKYRDLENRINAISKTYEKLYIKNDLEKIDMHEYVGELCNDLESASMRDIKFTISIENIFMSLKSAGYIGLIVNELITNSIKYVTQKNLLIEISISQDAQSYLLTFKDNGDGFATDRANGSGFGLKLVKTIVENQLEGSMEINIEDGLVYTMRFQL